MIVDNDYFFSISSGSGNSRGVDTYFNRWKCGLDRWVSSNVWYNFKTKVEVLCLSNVAGIIPATSHKHNVSTLLCIFCGNLSLFVSCAMLMRPNKAETAVHGY